MNTNTKVEEEGFFSSLFSGSTEPTKNDSSFQGSRGYYNPDFGER
jgi:hypothetical protein